MAPEQLFQLTNPFVMIGWVALALAPLFPRWSDRVAIAIPLLLSALYTALILIYWTSVDGGFDSLSNVMRLFDFPGTAYAGWVHFLAFDLFIGAWAVRIARREDIPHLLVLPCLLLMFLFGPAGLLAFFTLRMSFDLRTRSNQKV